MLMEDISYYAFKSNKEIIAVCDYCGDDVHSTIQRINKGRRYINKDSCKKCVGEKLQEVGIVKYGWTEEEIQLLKDNYNQCDSNKNLSDFGLNRSSNQISNMRKMLKIQKTNFKQTHNPTAGKNMDHNFFEEYNINSAYFAGLIASDGCVSKRVVKFGMGDPECFMELRKHLRSNSTVTKRLPKKGNYYYETNFTSQKIVKDLLEKWNIGERKSLFLLPPPIDHLSEEIILSFIIGYVDGDGWCYIQNRDKLFEFGVCGSRQMVTWIAKYLNMTSYIKECEGMSATCQCGTPAVKIYRRLKIIPTPIKMYRKWKFNFAEDNKTQLQEDVYDFTS